MDNFKNTILGLAVGDALGVPYEFSKRALLKLNLEMTSGGYHNQEAGTYSDDTALTLATIDSLSNGFNEDDLFSKFQDWYKNGAYAVNNKVFDIGITCKNALQKEKLIFEPFNNKNSGNGALMRMAPFIFYTKNMSSFDRKQIVYKAASITHASVLSNKACLFYVEFGINLLTIKGKEEAYKKTINSLKDILTEKEFSNILSGKIKKEPRFKIKSSGYVIDTLEAVLWCFLNNDNYEKIVTESIRLGGDTDTIAAISGSLAGLFYQDITEKYISKLKNLEFINEIILKYEARYDI